MATIEITICDLCGERISGEPERLDADLTMDGRVIPLRELHPQCSDRLLELLAEIPVVSDAEAPSPPPTRRRPERPRTTCPACGRDVSLLKNGTMHQHRENRRPGAMVCAGSGRDPLSYTPAQVKPGDNDCDGQGADQVEPDGQGEAQVKPGDNDCDGQGEAQVEPGDNDCDGQGADQVEPGDNDCDGQGADQVEPDGQGEAQVKSRGVKVKPSWPTCSVDGCSRNAYMPSGTLEMCFSHYQKHMQESS